MTKFLKELGGFIISKPATELLLRRDMTNGLRIRLVETEEQRDRRERAERNWPDNAEEREREIRNNEATVEQLRRDLEERRRRRQEEEE